MNSKGLLLAKVFANQQLLGGTMGAKSRFIQFLICFAIFSGSIGSAQADSQSGNYELIVNRGTCYEWMDQNLCGPVLQVRLPAMPWSSRTQDDDLASGVATLTNSNGARVGVYYASPHNGGLFSHDPTYRGPAVSWNTPTNLPFGSYSLSVKVTAEGHWTCSIYSSSGCYWEEPESAVAKYVFTWNSAFVLVKPTANAPKVLSIKKGSKSTGLALAKIAGIAVPKNAKVTFAITKSSKSVCSKSGSLLKAIKKGTCKITLSVQKPKLKNGKYPKPIKKSVTYQVK